MPTREAKTSGCKVSSFLPGLFVVVCLVLCIRLEAARADLYVVQGAASLSGVAQVQTSTSGDGPGDDSTRAQYMTHSYENSSPMMLPQDLYESYLPGRIAPPLTELQGIRRGVSSYGRSMRSIDNSIRNMNTNINRINTLGRQFRR